jgi:hypothetical protein
MESDIINYVGTIILAAGGLGVAAYGVIDGAKLLPMIGLSGFAHVRSQLGPAMAAIVRAYGAAGTKELLEAQYRAGRSSGELPRTLRQGYRIGLPALEEAEVKKIAEFVGVSDSGTLASATRKMRTGKTLTSDEREALSRFEVALDARIEAGLELADHHYVGRIKIYAGVLSVAIAMCVGALVSNELGANWWLKAFLVGLIAVPVAPIAKDVANAVTEAAKALRGR